jgi:hypothetical protein
LRLEEEPFLFVGRFSNAQKPQIPRPVGIRFCQEVAMDSTTLLIILIVLLVLGGGGYYGRGRWF